MKKKAPPRKEKQLLLKIQDLELQLAEAEETLSAIRSGAVDGLVVYGPEGEQVFTLKGADEAYRIMVETMNEGAVTISNEGMVLYCNSCFARLVQRPLEKVIGTRFLSLIDPADHEKVSRLFKHSETSGWLDDVRLKGSRNNPVIVHISSNALPRYEGYCLVATDISLMKKAEVALREFPKQLLEAQEKERKRVSRDLHDGVNQILGAAKHRLHGIEKLVESMEGLLPQEVKTSRQLLERSIQEIRRISRNLRPSELDDFGLITAIRSLGEEFQERTGIHLGLFLTPHWTKVGSEVEVTLYRIIQEGLTNIERHSNATKAEVHLKRNGRQFELVIRDNGRGIQHLESKSRKKSSAHRGGLNNIAERSGLVGGRFDIQTQVKGGTELRVQVPLSSLKPSHAIQ